MPSELGKLIRDTRQAQSVGLRELARRIGKSPAYLVSLERSDVLPGVSEETLVSLGKELALDPDLLLAMARKTPQRIAPKSATQIALYRLIGQLSPDRQEDLKTQLEKEVRSGKASG